MASPIRSSKDRGSDNASKPGKLFFPLHLNRMPSIEPPSQSVDLRASSHWLRVSQLICTRQAGRARNRGAWIAPARAQQKPGCDRQGSATATSLLPCFDKFAPCCSSPPVFLMPFLGGYILYCRICLIVSQYRKSVEYDTPQFEMPSINSWLRNNTL